MRNLGNFGNQVTLVGKYMGPAPKHEIPRKLKINNAGDLQPVNEIQSMVYFMQETQLPQDLVCLHTQTSLILNVYDINKMFKADHIIIQNKLDANYGDYVMLQGYVNMYKKPNLIDYCLNRTSPAIIITENEYNSYVF